MRYAETQDDLTILKGNQKWSIKFGNVLFCGDVAVEDLEIDISDDFDYWCTVEYNGLFADCNPYKEGSYMSVVIYGLYQNEGEGDLLHTDHTINEYLIQEGEL